MNGVGWAYTYAFAAKLTFVVIDVCQIIGDGNRIIGTLLLALAAADAGHVAGFFCHTSLVFVDTAYVDAA